MDEQERINLLLAEDDDGCVAVRMAAFSGHSECIKGILSAVDEQRKIEWLLSKNSDGHTTLHIAAREGRSDCIKAVLEQ